MFQTVGKRSSRRGDSTLVEEAKAADILSLAVSSGVQLTPESGRREYSGPCPVCSGTDCFHVNTTINGWFCRKCNGLERGGWKDPIDFLRHYQNMDFAGAIERLTGKSYRGRREGVSRTKMLTNTKVTPPPAPPVVERDEQDFTRYIEALPGYQAALPGSAGEEYMAARGISLETCKRFGVGFTAAIAVPTTGGKQKAPAIAFPWKSAGKVTGVRFRFLERHTAPSGKDFKQTSRGIFKGLMWGGDGLLGVHGFEGEPTERLRTLVICEGEINAMSIWQTSHAANLDVLSVGSESTIITNAMKNFIGRYGVVIVWMDRDEQCQRIMERLQGISGHAVGIPSPQDKDANDWHKEGMLQALMAYLRMAKASLGDVDVMTRTLWDYMDASDRGELELSSDTVAYLEEIANKIGVKFSQ